MNRLETIVRNESTGDIAKALKALRELRADESTDLALRHALRPYGVWMMICLIVRPWRWSWGHVFER